MTFSTYQYTRFAAQQLTVTTAVTLYTTPASTQALVKDININNTTAAAVTLTGFTVAGIALLSSLVIPANSTMRLTGLIVLAAGETIVAQAGTANALSIVISGQTGQ
jgi:hypothetical protein